MTTILEEPLAGNWIVSADGIRMPLFIKDPQDVRKYGFDWEYHLAEGDSIIAVSFATGNSALGVLSRNFVGTKAFVWLFGGVVTVTYLVTMHITTDFGYEMDRTFGILCGQN